MWLRTLLRSWLGRRHGPIQTRKTRRARNSVKPMLEILEDRLAPTVSLSYDATSGTLNVAAGYNGLDTGSPTLIKVYTNATNQLTIFTNDDTMSWSGTPPSSGFALSPTSGVLTDTTLTITSTITNLAISSSAAIAATDGANVALYPLSLAGSVSVSAPDQCIWWAPWTWAA